MVQLKIERLTKTFGTVRAVDNIDLTVEEGEFLTLLGPSGCGKSTTLGAIAGLDRPDGGRITLGDHVFFDGASATFVPPEGRDIGLVFQSYALWPHMTVRKNLEFPLSLRKVPAAERNRRIEEVLDLVEMGDYADRYPFALSGGQQQRVALARTLVYRPRLLLLDEPLSNLDAKLRERARLWLRDIQSRISVTTVYVTHDQTEALALSDRIAVMSGGRIVQLASPAAIYHAPASPFVADFIGSANIFSGEILHVEQGTTRLQLDGGGTLVTPSPPPEGTSGKVMIAVRPEKILFARDAARAGTENVFEVDIEARSFLGARHMVLARLGAVALRIECEWEPGTQVASIHIPAEACVLFDAPAPSGKAAAVEEAA